MTISRYYLRRVAPMWVLTLIAGSLMPGSAKVAIGSTTSERLGHPVAEAGPIHRAYHFVAFGSTAIILCFVSRNRGQRIAATAAVLALGARLEYTQRAVYGNPLEWWDIRDDFYGVLGAVSLLRLKPLNELVADYSLRERE